MGTALRIPLTLDCDPIFRENIADLICSEINDSSSDFIELTTFQSWIEDHKELLRGLFGGQGIQNISRVVAWARRYLRNKQRPDVLKLIADNAATPEKLPEVIRSALHDLGCFDMLDTLKQAILSPSLAGALMLPLKQDGKVPVHTQQLILTELRNANANLVMGTALPERRS